MKRSQRAWVSLGAASALYAVTFLATRKFPPAPLHPASVGLRARLESLRAFDAGTLARVAAERKSVGASALSTARAAEVQAQLAQVWNATALASESIGDLSLVHLALRRTDNWRELTAAIRALEQLPGISVSAVSVTARNGVLSAELQATIVAHTQPADDKASGLPAVVRTLQNH